MSRTLTSQDRSTLIRLASTLPSGSIERRAILSGLGKTSSSTMDQAIRRYMDKELDPDVRQDIQFALKDLMAGPFKHPSFDGFQQTMRRLSRMDFPEVWVSREGDVTEMNPDEDGWYYFDEEDVKRITLGALYQYAR